MMSGIDFLLLSAEYATLTDCSTLLQHLSGYCFNRLAEPIEAISAQAFHISHDIEGEQDAGGTGNAL